MNQEIMKEALLTGHATFKSPRLPDPEIVQAMTMLEMLSDKGRKQALAILAVIHRFDKGNA